MNVKLISITDSFIPHPEKSGEILNAEELIVYIARVSNPGNQMNTETADRLIAYLIKNKHWSPFEMVDMTVEIETSRAIAQQILRHRSFSFQEFSQRYAAATAFEDVQIRRQAEKNRQSSTEEFNPVIEIEFKGPAFADYAIKIHLEQANELYKALLAADVAKEVARMVLPLTTQTRIYMKGSLRSWIHYLQIRCDPHTQQEHRQVAEDIREIFHELFPNISKAIQDDEQKSHG